MPDPNPPQPIPGTPPTKPNVPGQPAPKPSPQPPPKPGPRPGSSSGDTVWLRPRRFPPPRPGPVQLQLPLRARRPVPWPDSSDIGRVRLPMGRSATAVSC